MALFMVLAAAAATFAVWRQLTRRENFEGDEKEEKAPVAPSASASPEKDVAVVVPDKKAATSATSATEVVDYDRRRYVMSVFDTVLHRKATQSEVAKYIKLDGEPAMLAAIVSDFDMLPGAKPPSVPAATASASAQTAARPPPAGVEEKFGSSSAAIVDDDVDEPGRPAAAPGESAVGRVYLDRQDVIKRLRAISTEINQFYQLVTML